MLDPKTLSGEKHRELFIDFCDKKLGVQGPDIHMKVAGVGTEEMPYFARTWRLCVYNAFCSTPSAAAVWSRWSPYGVRHDGGDDFKLWVEENWAGIPIRRNRRPMRSVGKLTRCMVSLSEWYVTDMNELHNMSYQEAWKSLDPVYSYGRYVKIKLLETFRRYIPGHEHLEAPDIHAAGGWSPRRTLGYLYPKWQELLTSKSSAKSVLEEINAIAKHTQQLLANHDVTVSIYELEALLCNYRQTFSGTYYVGRTIDSEIDYDAKAVAHFGEDPYKGTFDFWGTRKKVFPNECLGELHGWGAIRKDVCTVLGEHGYVWSDRVFDYNATVANGDFANPVMR